MVPPVSQAVHQHLRFLIVDDEAGVRHILKRIIPRTFPGHGGLHVEEADSPQAALERVSSIPHDEARLIVISDYNLGSSTTGIQLLRAVGDRRPDARRVLISGYDRRTFAEELEGTNLDAFMPKPFRMAELRQLLQKLAA